MAGMYGLSREAVRVKVKKCERNLPPEWRKFSVDPQITSLEVLYSILAKAFDLKTDFSISYKTLDPNGQEVHLPVLSDWDLDAAFLRAHNYSISMGTDPCLSLKVDIKPFSEATDWDATTTTTTRDIATPLQQSIGAGQKYVQNMQTRLPGFFMNHMEKTFSMVTRALNFVEDQSILQPMRQPLSDQEFRSFLDSVGQIVQPNKLRNVIYGGGIDPSLRRVVWKHILNVYPDGMTGRQRMDYMKRKALEYSRLRDVWKKAVQQGPVTGELAYVTSMVRKDVLRTDRLHPFYAGNDDNQNIASLFNILTTYALNHPNVSYCQGMSDIASPLLVTMCDEAQAYICFCAVMKRLNINFMLDGIAMTQKFAHLSEALQFYDPEFYDYLKLQQADDLLFCYRWLLLEMKREFAFDDSLRMLEVLWSSLPPEPPDGELSLFEREFVPPANDLPLSPKTTSTGVVLRQPRENAYTKLCALRRQSSSQSLLPTSPSTLNTTDPNSTKGLDATKRLNQSLDESRNRRSIEIISGRKSFQSLDESKLREITHQSTIAPRNENHDNTSSNQLEVKNNEKNQKNSREQTPNHINDIKNSTSPTKPSDQSIQQNHAEQNHIDQTATTIATTTNNNIIPTTNESSTTESSSRAGHFKDLKDRIAAGKKEIFASLDKIENFPFKDFSSSTNDLSDESLKSGKIVKNFNEFLNLASKGAKLTLNRSNSINSPETHKKSPGLRLTKSSHQNLDSIKTNDNEPSPQTQADGEQNPEILVDKKKLQLQLDDKRQLSFDGSSPDDSQEYFPMTTSITRELRLELDNLNRQVFGNSFSSQFNLNARTNSQLINDTNECNTPESADSHISNNKSPAKFKSEILYTKLNQSSEDDQHLDKIYRCPSEKNILVENNNESHFRGATIEPNDMKRTSTASVNADVFVWENPLHQLSPTTPNASATTTRYLNECKNPFFEKDFLQTLTPDEQNELEYDGEIIDESAGKKLITPIRLLRKGHDDGAGGTARSNNSSKRNSNVYRNESDTESSTEVSEQNENRNINILMTTSTLSETNPFLMDIAASFDQAAITPSLTGKSENEQRDCVNQETIDEEASEAESNVVLQKGPNSLPSSSEFGGGNPFLMFLCLTLLLQHRNYVMKNNMEYNEIAMHFDKMVRKHNVVRVLNQARRMYADYLKQNLHRAGGDANSKAGNSSSDGKPNSDNSSGSRSAPSK